MTRTIVKPLPHDLAVKTALATTGVPVYWGSAPSGAIGTDGLPVADYMTMWRIGGQRDGTLSDPYGDGNFTYQITSTGKLPDGASRLAGLIESALLGVTITGRTVVEVEPLLEQGPFPDRDVGPPHPFYAISQYRLVTAPA